MPSGDFRRLQKPSRNLREPSSGHRKLPENKLLFLVLLFFRYLVAVLLQPLVEQPK